MNIKTLSRMIPTNGKVFSVTFRKRTTGEMRVMNCRVGVKKGVKGVGATYNPIDKGLLTVYDMNKRGFRSIPADAITALKVDGTVFKVS